MSGPGPDLPPPLPPAPGGSGSPPPAPGGSVGLPPAPGGYPTGASPGRSGRPVLVVVGVLLALILAGAGLFVLLRGSGTPQVAPPPPSVPAAPAPELSGLDLPDITIDPELPELPELPDPTEAPGGAPDPVDVIWLVFDADPRTAGRYTREEVGRIARWACQRIAAWEGDPATERLALWRRMQERFGLDDMSMGPIVTGVLEPVCSNGRGDAV